MDALPPRSAWRVRSKFPEPPQSGPDTPVEPGVDAIPVRMVVVQDDHVTGWDDGALGFEEEAMWFSGEATSFQIVAADVRSRLYSRHEASRMSTSRIVAYGLPLAHPTRDVRIRFGITAPDRRDWEDEERIASEIRRLWQTESSRGESQYPPLVLRPGIRVVTWQEWAARRTLEASFLPEPLNDLVKFFFGGRQSWLSSEANRLMERIADEESAQAAFPLA